MDETGDSAHPLTDLSHAADVLHDIVGHHLVLLTTQTRIWRAEGGGCDPKGLARLADMSEAALRGLRRVSTLLRGGHIEKPAPNGLVQWMKELPAQVPDNVVDVSTTVSGSSFFQVTPAQEILIERIVREGVANAAKHSTGGRVEIQLEFGSEILVTISSVAGRTTVTRTERECRSGLNGLVKAVTQSGGRVTTRLRAADHFTLEVALPG
jgi:signal transduction histidine kinase